MDMRRYIRADAAGAAYFFTVVLQDRSARYLVDHIAELRESIRIVKQRHPFEIEAMVVLPEHLHAIWRLPVDDAGFSSRWMLVKQSFTRALEQRGTLDEKASALRSRKGERSWPYSSLHRFVREGRLPQDWGISAAIAGQFGE